MNSIYENLLTNMSKKLSDKVQQFLQTKQTEIRDWGTNEIKTWNQQLTDLIASLEKSLVDDSQRQLQRDQLHAQAQAWRDLNLTNSIEEIEKETTRKQIQEAKRLCNTEKAIDSRMLQVSLSLSLLVPFSFHLPLPFIPSLLSCDVVFVWCR
jgi:DNA replication protein DnaC